MALITSSPSQDWVHLVEVADVTLNGVSGQTWRIADRDIALSNGYFYEGRILEVPPIRLSAGRLISPRPVGADITLVLKNADDEVRTILDDNYGLAGKTFTIKIGQGTDASDYETRFTGIVSFPGGVEWDEEVAIVRLDNTLFSELSTVIPENKFFPSTYPTAEEKSKYLPIPIIIGDWSSTAGNGEQVPCFAYEQVSSKQWNFKIAETLSIRSILAVYRNGTDITSQLTWTSPVNSTFSWYTSYPTDPYDPETDIITAHVLGRPRSVFTLGRYYSPANVCYDLLVNVIGISGAKIDNNAFDEWDRNCGPDDEVRRWIGTETAAWTLIGELLDEAFYELTINENGLYTVSPRWVQAEADNTVFRGVDLKPKQGGGREFRVTRDPERTYANQVVADYLRKPGEWDSAEPTVLNTEVSHAATTTKNDSTAQTNVGQTRRQRLKLNWLFQENGAADRAERHLMAFGDEVEMLEATFGPAAITLYPGDQFRLIYSKYEILSTLGTPFMVREIEPDVVRMLARVRAWNLDSLSAKRYQADGSPAYGSASAYDQQVMGFYEANAEQVYF